MTAVLTMAQDALDRLNTREAALTALVGLMQGRSEYLKPADLRQIAETAWKAGRAFHAVERELYPAATPPAPAAPPLTTADVETLAAAARP